MNVEKVFRFEDGRIVFSGNIQGNSDFIKACECSIFLNDRFFKKIRIEGEMMPKKMQKNTLRAISTLDPIDLSQVDESDIKIICC